MRLKPVEEQVVVVMGGSTGIGRLTALEFARRGAAVVVAARGEESLRQLVEQIRGQGGRALAVTADISQPEQVRAVAAAAEREFGRIDTWINMAATSVYAPFEQTSPEEFRRVLEVNLLGYVHGMQAALPILKRQGGGAILNVSSVEEEVAMPFHAAYAASKHGVGAVADALRMELLHDKVPVSVTNIKPASINTPFFDHAKTKLGVKPRGVPPVYQPEEVVGAILYAAHHPVREMVVGRAGRSMIRLRRFLPNLEQGVLSLVGFRGQKTEEPRSERSPHSMTAPMPGDTRIKQEPDARVRPVREPSWLSLHPKTRAVTFLGAGLALFAGWRRFAQAR